MNFKKLIVLSFLILQSSGLIYADAWTNAFIAFGGSNVLQTAVDFIKKNVGKKNYRDMQAIADNLNNSPEALAVGLYLSSGRADQLPRYFPGAALRTDLLSALATAQNSGGSYKAAADKAAADKAAADKAAADKAAADKAVADKAAADKAAADKAAADKAAADKAAADNGIVDIDTAAATLKDQIKASQMLYNEYAAAHNKPTMVVVQ